MSERKYSVAELDALRIAVRNKFVWGRYIPVPMRGVMSRCFRDGEIENSVEQMVRTHMLSGHTSEDLYASEKPSNNRMLINDR